MTIEDQIKVMQHFADGGEVECKHCMLSDWERDVNPTWNWNTNTYRIKPEPQKPEDRIEAEYPEFDVIPLEWSSSKLRFEGSINPHIYAQSMKGFAGYVYLDNNGELIEHIHPVLELGFGRLHPVAVLFTKDSKEEA